MFKYVIFSLFCILCIKNSCEAAASEADILFAFNKNLFILQQKPFPIEEVLNIQDYIDARNQAIEKNWPLIISVNKGAVPSFELHVIKLVYNDYDIFGIQEPMYIVGIPDGKGNLNRFDCKLFGDVINILNRRNFPPTVIEMTTYGCVGNT